LKGLRNGILGPSISRLLFVDDNIFFTRGDKQSVSTLKSVLQILVKGLDNESIYRSHPSSLGIDVLMI
jgi:hypothetical protein